MGERLWKASWAEIKVEEIGIMEEIGAWREGHGCSGGSFNEGCKED